MKMEDDVLQEKEQTRAFNEMIRDNDPLKLLQSAFPFQRLMAQYRCALEEIRAKFEVLNMELSLKRDANPIESISCRIKKPVSIIEKLRQKGLDFSLDNIERNIFDVAGIRIVCSFTDDIYHIAERICLQEDIRLLRIKDYIKNPKENGYRSLHLVVSVPVVFAEESKMLPVEIQFRTIAMDFWASIEHKLRYKKNLSEDISKAIANDLWECADKINDIDNRMQDINRRMGVEKKA